MGKRDRIRKRLILQGRGDLCYKPKPGKEGDGLVLSVPLEMVTSGRRSDPAERQDRNP